MTSHIELNTDAIIKNIQYLKVIINSNLILPFLIVYKQIMKHFVADSFHCKADNQSVIGLRPSFEHAL